MLKHSFDLNIARRFSTGLQCSSAAASSSAIDKAHSDPTIEYSNSDPFKMPLAVSLAILAHLIRHPHIHRA